MKENNSIWKFEFEVVKEKHGFVYNNIVLWLDYDILRCDSSQI